MRNLFCCVILLAGGLQAATNYVDCTLGDYAGHDGSSWEKAFKTIQEAVDAARSDDVVMVAPGEYRDGCREGETGKNRVFIPAEKSGLTIKSSGSASDTFIVGEGSGATAVDGMGNGPDAVRCIACEADNVTVEGFTLAAGTGQPSVKDENSAKANGGGWLSVSADLKSCLVDCVVSNCVGVRGGGMFRGRAVRTLFADNDAGKKGAAANNSRFSNCVFTRNGGSCSTVVTEGELANSTFYRNDAASVGSENAVFKNCLFLLNPGICDAYSKVFATNCVFGGGGTRYVSMDDDTIAEAPVYQLANPMFDDIRPLPGSAAVSAGEAKWIPDIEVPARVDLFKDFFGNRINREGVVAAGAVQTPCEEPQGGILAFAGNGSFEVDSAASRMPGEYVTALTYPCQFQVAVKSAEGKQFFGFYRSGNFLPGGGFYHFPLIDDTIWMLPPKSGVLTNELVYAKKVLYVNPGLDDYTGHDGSSSGNALKTIQEAVDKCGTSISLISCASGVYDSEDNVTTLLGMRNRVSVSGDQAIRIVGAGAGKSIIEGKYDDSDPGKDDSKRGSGAMRCYATKAKVSVLQGFTLRKGRCGYENGGATDVEAHRGGGVYQELSKASAQQILDCRFEDCIGYRGALFGGSCIRCVFSGCVGYNGGIRYAHAVSCVILGDSLGRGGAMCSNNSVFDHCTIVGRSSSDSIIAEVPVTNSVVFKGSAAASLSFAGSCAWEADGVAAGQKADPQFVDAASSNYNLLNTTPCRTCTVVGDWNSYAAAYSPDCNGHPLVFTDGLPMAGACHKLGKALSVSSGNGVVFTPSGTVGIEAGESVVVAWDESSATRPFSGLLVNGVEKELPPSGSIVVKAPAKCDGDREPFTLAPVFSTNWYVNANVQGEGGNGFRPATAARTLAAVFGTGFVKAGDCVHAEEGYYDDGEMTQESAVHSVPSAGEAFNPARVIVPSGVTLVGEKGAEKTFIVGAPSPTPAEKTYGCGPLATRCAIVHPGAVIRGFTITGGRTGYVNADNDNNSGGGVLGNGGTIDSCIVSNNVAVRGGAGINNNNADKAVTYVNCRILENVCTLGNTSAARYAKYYGCIIDGNRGNFAVNGFHAFEHCTVGPDNAALDGSSTTMVEGNANAVSKPAVVNSIIAGTVNYATLSNTLYVSAGGCAFGEGSKRLSVADMWLDDRLAPAIGKSPAVDAGAGELDRFAHMCDAYGNQRVYNGAIDIGAVEADWRGTYAAHVHRTRCSVACASPDVTLYSGVLTVGKCFAATLRGGDRRVYSIPVCVRGSGTLSVFLNGEKAAEFAAWQGENVFSFKNALPANDIEFRHEGDDGGFATIGALESCMAGFRIIAR